MSEHTYRIDNCPEAINAITNGRVHPGTRALIETYCPVTGLAQILLTRHEDGDLYAECITRSEGYCKSKIVFDLKEGL